MTSRTGNRVGAAAVGFTLVEVCVAVFILSAGVVAVVQACASAVTALDAASDTLAATEVLTRCRESLELERRDGTPITSTYRSGAIRVADRDFRWDGRVAPGAALDGARTWDVTFTAGRAGTNRRYALATRWAEALR